MTARTLTAAEAKQIRSYAARNPDATPAAICGRFGLDPSAYYAQVDGMVTALRDE